MRWIVYILVLLVPSFSFCLSFQEIFKQEKTKLPTLVSSALSHVALFSCTRSCAFDNSASELQEKCSKLLDYCAHHDSPWLTIISDGFCELGERFVEMPFKTSGKEEFDSFLITFFLFIEWLLDHREELDFSTQYFLKIFDEVIASHKTEGFLRKWHSLNDSTTLVLPPTLPLFSLVHTKKIEDALSDSVAQCVEGQTRMITGLEPFLISGAISFLQAFLKPFISCALAAIAFYWFRHEVFSFFKAPLKKQLKLIKQQNRESMRIIEELADQKLTQVVREIEELQANFYSQEELIQNLQRRNSELDQFTQKNLKKLSSIYRSFYLLKELYLHMTKTE